MKIEETIKEEGLLINAKDPYDEALEIMDRFSKAGDVVVKENVLKTDGPRNASVVDFWLEEALDEYSKLRAECRMNGLADAKGGQLSISLKITFECSINSDNKLLVGAFERYYLSGPIRLARKKAEDRADWLLKFVREHRIFSH